MSIVAAKCPVCGRDIGFDENTAEYTCIFCGSKLMTSALKKERVESNEKRRGEAGQRERVVRERDAQPRPSEPPRVKEPAPIGESDAGEELSEEEKNRELERKAGFKTELRSVVKQIDELRAKRSTYSSQLKTAKVLSVVGVVFVCAVLIAVFLMLDSGKPDKTYVIVGGAIAGGIGLFTTVFSLMRRSETEKARKQLEEKISEKKQKRDVLIGRLNKINKKLHIHSDE